MGYFQCMYALNAAHSKFTKLFRTVFPPRPRAPFRFRYCYVPVAHPAHEHLRVGALGRGPLYPQLVRLVGPSVCGREREHSDARRAPTPVASWSIFGRWGASSFSASLVPCSAQEKAKKRECMRPAEGPVEMIVAGTAFCAFLLPLESCMEPYFRVCRWVSSVFDVNGWAYGCDV
ncbi:hypothetical protein C8R44DRAFT_988711 [Mycena epipterygia]|nr:hypothetical protein C8R44DRAFT_988711 [Mycena epipterygia]